jgi:hypothetical protein
MNWDRSFLVAVLSLGIVLLGCRPSVSHDEVSKVWSPSGQLAATLYEENGGATTSFGYEVELSGKTGSARKTVAKLYGAIRNRQAYGVNLRWSDNTTLTIECLKTDGPVKINSPSELDGHVVTINLQSGIDDKTAPAGGMKFNENKSTP